MLNWSSSQEIANDTIVYEKLVHIVFGLYFWEWITSFDFDLLLLTGKRKFKWPMVFYLSNRYCMLAALSVLVASFNAQNEFNCQPLYVFCQLMGSSAMGLTSVNLSVRVLAIWKGNNYVICAVIAMIIGHWVLLIRLITSVHASWVDGQGCQVIGISAIYSSIVYSYAMLLDFTVMILTGIKIRFGRGDYNGKLVRLLYTDGIMYFAVAFVVNLFALVFIILDLNPVMTAIAEVPGTTIATIVACRVIRNLSLFIPGQGLDICNIKQSDLSRVSSQERPVTYSDSESEEQGSPQASHSTCHPHTLDLEHGGGKV